MRTTITLPDPVFENAKAAAQERGITLSKYIHEALLTEMHRPPTPKPRIELPTVPGRFVDELDTTKISALLELEDEERYGKLS